MMPSQSEGIIVSQGECSMNIRVYYFGVLLTLFSPLGAMSEPCGSLEVDDLITNLLTIKELTGVAIATPALDAVLSGVAEPSIAEMDAALSEATICLAAAKETIAPEKYSAYENMLGTYRAGLALEQNADGECEVVRSRKNKTFCKLVAQVACIRRLKVGELAVIGDAAIGGNLSVGGDLAVAGNETIAGNLDVGGSETIANNLIVGGDTIIEGNLIVDGSISFTIAAPTFVDTTDSATFDCLTFEKSRAGAIVQNGDTIGCILFEGFDGAAFQPGAEIQAQVDGTPGAGDMPGRLIFSSTPDGSATPVERMRINNAGLVTFANSIDLPNTLSTAVGMFSKAGSPFLHNFGTDNTFLGVDSGNLTLTTASENVGVGSGALSVLTTGDSNVGIGFNTANALTTGSFNIGIGTNSLSNLITGNNNTAVGFGSAGGESLGSDNTAVGFAALGSAGHQREVAIGANAFSQGSSAFTRTDNVIIGANAGLTLGNVPAGTAVQNVFVGQGAGGTSLVNVNVTSVSQAVFVGSQAGSTVANGLIDLVAVGFDATAGSSNTVAVGRSARATLGNSSAIGDRAVSNAINSVTLGATSTTNGVFAYGVYTNLSDERVKRNMKECPLGLAFIRNLKPLEYERGCEEECNCVKELGFSAQAVAKAAEECGSEFHGVRQSEESGLYFMSYGSLMAPVVKAVQELSAEVDCLKAKNDRLEHALVRAGISL